jgi:catechol 2,3-dioxygenase-like lactoylglutathione lyase family enzyme
MFRYAASNKSMSVDMSTVCEEESMSRVQLALNVSDVDAAVEFYSQLFGVAPAKRRPGYANFAIDEPALKLVLIENASAPATLNHLGVEVASPGEVGAAQARLAGEGLATATEENVSCCYAVQDKVWVSDPDGAPWEIYTVLADADTMGCRTVDAAPAPAPAGGDVCCATVTDGC